MTDKVAPVRPFRVTYPVYLIVEIAGLERDQLDRAVFNEKTRFPVVDDHPGGKFPIFTQLRQAGKVWSDTGKEGRKVLVTDREMLAQALRLVRGKAEAVVFDTSGIRGPDVTIWPVEYVLKCVESDEPIYSN